MNKSSKKVMALYLSTAAVLMSQPALSAIYGNSSGGSAKISFNNTLVNAAEYGDIGALKSMLKAGEDPNQRGDFDTTALLRAAYQGNADAVKALLLAGANPNLADIGGATPLHVASRQGHKTVVDILLKSGANVNIADAEGYTPLMRASIQGEDKLIDGMIASGAKIDTRNSFGETAVEQAAKSKSNIIVSKLLSEEEKTPEKTPEKPVELAADTKALNELMPASTTSSWSENVSDELFGNGTVLTAVAEQKAPKSSFNLLDFGSYKTEEEANKKLGELKTKYADTLKGLNVVVVEKTSNGNSMYHINAGLLDSKEDAVSRCKTLTAKGEICRPVETKMMVSQLKKAEAAATTVAPKPTGVTEEVVASTAEAAPSPIVEKAELPVVKKAEVATAVPQEAPKLELPKIVANVEAKPEVKAETKTADLPVLLKPAAPKLEAKAEVKPEVKAETKVAEAPKAEVKPVEKETKAEAENIGKFDTAKSEDVQEEPSETKTFFESLFDSGTDEEPTIKKSTSVDLPIVASSLKVKDAEPVAPKKAEEIVKPAAPAQVASSSNPLLQPKGAIIAPAPAEKVLIEKAPLAETPKEEVKVAAKAEAKPTSSKDLPIITSSLKNATPPLPEMKTEPAKEVVILEAKPTKQTAAELKAEKAAEAKAKAEEEKATKLAAAEEKKQKAAELKAEKLAEAKAKAEDEKAAKLAAAEDKKQKEADKIAEAKAKVEAEKEAKLAAAEEKKQKEADLKAQKLAEAEAKAEEAKAAKLAAAEKKAQKLAEVKAEAKEAENASASLPSTPPKAAATNTASTSLPSTPPKATASLVAKEDLAIPRNTAMNDVEKLPEKPVGKAAAAPTKTPVAEITSTAEKPITYHNVTNPVEVQTSAATSPMPAYQEIVKAPAPRPVEAPATILPKPGSNPEMASAPSYVPNLKPTTVVVSKGAVQTQTQIAETPVPSYNQYAQIQAQQPTVQPQAPQELPALNTGQYQNSYTYQAPQAELPVISPWQSQQQAAALQQPYTPPVIAPVEPAPVAPVAVAPQPAPQQYTQVVQPVAQPTAAPYGVNPTQVVVSGRGQSTTPAYQYTAPVPQFAPQQAPQYTMPADTRNPLIAENKIVQPPQQIVAQYADPVPVIAPVQQAPLNNSFGNYSATYAQPQPAPQQTAQRSSGGQEMWVNVGYFTNQSSARGFWNRIAANSGGQYANYRMKTIRPTNSNNVSAEIGPIYSSQDAQGLCNTIASEGLSCDISGANSLRPNSPDRYGEFISGQRHSNLGAASQVGTVGENIASADYNTWSVQLGTFDSKQAAENSWDNLTLQNRVLQGLKYNVSSSESSSRQRLRAGKFSSTEAAQSVCEELRRNYVSCIIVRAS